MTFPPEGYSQEAATDGVRAWAQEGRIARIAMARPERRNAQDASMLYGPPTGARPPPGGRRHARVRAWLEARRGGAA